MNGLGEPVAGRIGDWMQLAGGRRFWPLDPRPDEVHIEDIANALSRICRFGGHCRFFYSVAEHSVRVSRECCPREALAGLLHDAAEAYIGDLIRPLKVQPELSGYRVAEGWVEAVIAERFGLAELMTPSVREADEILLATEKRDLFLGAGDWRLSHPPLDAPIIPWTSTRAAAEFLLRFKELTR